MNRNSSGRGVEFSNILAGTKLSSHALAGFPRKCSGNVPRPFGVYLLHSLRFGANEVLFTIFGRSGASESGCDLRICSHSSASTARGDSTVRPGQTATPARVLRATAQYSICGWGFYTPSTPTSRSYADKSLKAAEPHLEVLEASISREGVSL